MHCTIFTILLIFLLGLASPSQAYWFEYTTPEMNYPIAANDTLVEMWPSVLPFQNGNTLVVYFKNYSGNLFQIYDLYGQPIFDEAQLICPDRASVASQKLNAFPDGEGGVFICGKWSEQSPPGYVGVQHLDSQGNRLWGNSGVEVYPFDGYWDICSDGYGGCYFAISYTPQGAFDQDTWLQHINSSGEAAWGDSGIVAASGPHDQRFPKVVKDNLGGVYVVWQDFRPPYTIWGSLHMQRFDSTGSEMWTSGGLYLCGSTWFHQLIPDEENGFILHANPESSVYNNVLRVNPAGEILWQRHHASWYDDAVMVPGEPGFFYLGYWFTDDLWDPIRSIFAQRMDMDGNFYWPHWSMGIPGAEMARFEYRAFGNHYSFAFHYPRFYGIYNFRHPDYPDDYPDVLFLQAMDLEGNKIFGDNGTLLTYINPTPNMDQFVEADVAPDQEGGAVGVWCSWYYDGEEHYDIWAKHVNADGSLGGPDPRVRPLEIYPQISGISDGRIQFEIPASGHVEVDLYNLLGQHIGIIEDAYLQPGKHSVTIDQTGLVSGIYFVRVKTPQGVCAGKVVVVR